MSAKLFSNNCHEIIILKKTEKARFSRYWISFTDNCESPRKETSNRQRPNPIASYRFDFLSVPFNRHVPPRDTTRTPFRKWIRSIPRNDSRWEYLKRSARDIHQFRGCSRCQGTGIPVDSEQTRIDPNAISIIEIEAWLLPACLHSLCGRFGTHSCWPVMLL